MQGDETKYDFSFDNIMGQESSQSELFQIVARPVIESKFIHSFRSKNQSKVLWMDLTELFSLTDRPQVGKHLLWKYFK